VPSASLLLLDEPFSGVDPLWVENLCQLLRSQAQSGTSVLLSSHSLAEVEQVCDRVTLLEQGEVVLSGAAAEVLAEPQTFEIHVRLAADSAVDAQTLEEALRSRFEGVQVQVRPRRRSLAALLRDRRPGRTPH
jgi:ABC-type multidrug transport system ATPase subunit